MTMQRSLFIALFLLSLIWGGSYYFIKVLIDDFGPWTVVFLRSALGLVVITAVMMIMRKPFQFRNMPWLSVSIMALVNTCIPWAIIGFSETRLTSSMASMLNATTSSQTWRYPYR
jgi:drug/metabolite transporter (DMT)-like permease